MYSTECQVSSSNLFENGAECERLSQQLGHFFARKYLLALRDLGNFRVIRILAKTKQTNYSARYTLFCVPVRARFGAAFGIRHRRYPVTIDEDPVEFHRRIRAKKI